VFDFISNTKSVKTAKSTADKNHKKRYVLSRYPSHSNSACGRSVKRPALFLSYR